MTQPETAPTREQEIQQRLAARTQGAWEIGSEWVYFSPAEAKPTDALKAIARKIEHQPDVELIAHAPSDLAYLLDRCRALEASLAAEKKIVVVSVKAIEALRASLATAQRESQK